MVKLQDIYIELPFDMKKGEKIFLSPEAKQQVQSLLPAGKYVFTPKQIWILLAMALGFGFLIGSFVGPLIP